MKAQEITIRKKYNFVADIFVNNKYAKTVTLGPMTIKAAAKKAEKMAKEAMANDADSAVIDLYAKCLCIGTTVGTPTEAVTDIYDNMIRML